jgi:hypothetical protein
METRQKSVLFAGVGDAVGLHISRLLAECEIASHRMDWEHRIFDDVFEHQFDVIVIGFPVPGADFGRLLSSVRSRGSKSRKAGLILIADPGSVENAVSFIGRGVSRVLMASTPDITLLENINELLHVKPRIPIRTAARILADVQRGPKFSLCQTENLSVSGMLLRGWNHLPVGFTFDFELDLPGVDEPLRGRATVARATTDLREGFEGIGVAFDSLPPEDANRIESFVAQHLN